MNQYYYLLPKKSDASNKISPEKKQKVLFASLNHVYMQTHVAILSSFFCASIIFLGVYNSQENNGSLFVWAAIFIIINLLRAIISSRFNLDEANEDKILFWRNLYILGSFIGGLSWGLIAIFLFPQASESQQMLMILMLAGVTAGAVPLSSALPFAAIAFLIAAILPFIISIGLLQNHTFFLFDFALTLYLIYTFYLTRKSYKLIYHSILLKFDNDILLHNLEHSNKKLEFSSTHDPLTQVANRSLFKSNMQSAIRRAHGSNKILALFYIDLDHFKAINDTYGHQAGDHILITVIDRLKLYFANEDIVSRLGGDELAIIIENAHNRHEIEIIAKDICALIAIPIPMNNDLLKVSASIGISFYPSNGDNEDSLLKRSDQCMYYVKERGGNNFHIGEDEKLV